MSRSTWKTGRLSGSIDVATLSLHYNKIKRTRLNSPTSKRTLPKASCFPIKIHPHSKYSQPFDPHFNHSVVGFKFLLIIIATFLGRILTLLKWLRGTPRCPQFCLCSWLHASAYRRRSRAVAQSYMPLPHLLRNLDCITLQLRLQLWPNWYFLGSWGRFSAEHWSDTSLFVLYGVPVGEFSWVWSCAIIRMSVGLNGLVDLCSVHLSKVDIHIGLVEECFPEFLDIFPRPPHLQVHPCDH